MYDCTFSKTNAQIIEIVNNIKFGKNFIRLKFKIFLYLLVYSLINMYDER